MRRPSAELLSLLTVAAEQRATGKTWDAVAARVGRRAETCRRWPWTYRDCWRRLYAHAAALCRDEAAAEAVAFLRKLLRSEDDRTCRDAARILVLLRNDEAPSDADDAEADEAAAVAAYLREVPHAEVQELAEEPDA